jgi:hypothetical protein
LGLDTACEIVLIKLLQQQTGLLKMLQAAGHSSQGPGSHSTQYRKDLLAQSVSVLIKQGVAGIFNKRKLAAARIVFQRAAGKRQKRTPKNVALSLAKHRHGR